MIVAAFLGLTVIFVIVGALSDSSPSVATPPAQPAPDVPNGIDAFTMAQQFVKESLKAPSTADFGSVFGDYQNPSNAVSQFPDKTYQVKIWVDAQNSFGAKIRSHFTLHLRYDGNQRWTLLGGIQPDD